MGCDGAICHRRLASGRLKKLVGSLQWKRAFAVCQFDGRSLGARGPQANVGSMERSDWAT